MKIVWDEIKRRTNIKKHGLDFADLTEDVFAEAAIIPAKDQRWKAVGKLTDGTIAVIFATLGTEAISVLSMRPANRSERKLIQ
jgi:uncharacterized protein